MCGITGFLTRPASESNDAMAAIVARMSETLALRGPDAQRTWVDDAAGCALGHRRLSIIDLSEHGAQPMHSACGRFVIVFNGEIYNHRELRAELEAARAAPPWRGHSDTEILLAAIAHWGLPGAVARLTGMFAFALWDRQAHALSLVRDRLGEKPLYYGWSSGSFLFGSELKALRAHPDWRGEIDRGALTLFLRYAYVPAPHSIYTGVRKLQPGTILTLHAGIAHGALPEPVPYWNAAEVASAGQRTPFAGSVDDAVNALGAKLGAAVSGQMIADVPLGAFLSGGIDSSTIVALMQSQSARPVKTFTIGFAEDAYDEAAHAAVVARHLGTDHHELYVSAQDALDVIPRLPDMYDEPFADSSQIPTHLVARMARQQVTVSLSGDGGDELFGGYTRHDWTGRLWNSMRRYPQSLRAAAARLATIPSPATWDAVFDALAMLTPRRLHLSHPGEKMHKVAGVLDAGSAQEIYLRLASQWQAPAAVVIDGSEPPLAARAAAAWEIGNDIAHSQMYLDLISYLPDDILVKVDRAAMGISLETRVPFLDRHVVEFAWQLPLAMKIRDGRGKWLLRQLLYKHVPAALVERPKTGFGVPIDSWLRGPLKEWAAALLDPTRLAREGYLHAEPVTRLWQEHLSGWRNHQHALWNVIMFQTWLAAQHAIPHA